MGKRRERTEDIGIEFEDGFAAGWAFSVPEAARPRLDIQLGERRDGAGIKRSVWTRGDPPLYGFIEGAMYCDPPAAARKAWHDAPPDRVLQVRDSVPDTPEDDGSLIYSLTEYRDGEVISCREGRCSQAAFAAFLETGVEPEKAA